MKILLTGSTGMVGKNILDSPLASKYDFLTPSRIDLDLKNQSEVFKYLKKNNPETIIHCAAIVGGIQANINEPLLFLNDNLQINFNIIKSANDLEIKNFLFIASSCIYPSIYNYPITEDMLLTNVLEKTNEGYALAKITGLKMCEYIDRKETYNYKTLIPCNLYGKYDNFNIETSHLIPAIINKLHNAKNNNTKTVEVWGTGDARREFMYACDFADAVLFYVENLKKIPNYINVGIGKDYSVNEYYQIIANVIGEKFEFINNINKPEGMKRKLLDISLQQKLGWTPITSLEDGINSTYLYYLSKINEIN